VTDRVDLWKAPLEAGDAALERYRGTLSPAERERAARFAFDRERQAFVASRGLLRRVLSRLAGAPPGTLRIEEDALGKPRLGGECGQGRVRFNVSHSGGLWACAVALHREVGLDIERIDPARAGDRIAERTFSPSEVVALRALPEGERVAAFHRCWTRKEAYLKARGFGISIPLDSFEVTLGPGEPARLLATRPDPADAGRWSLVDLNPGPGFAGALCVEGREGAVVRWRGLRV